MINYGLNFTESPVVVDTISGIVYLNPNFRCPFEGSRPESRVYSGTINIQYNKEYDFNNLMDFKLPCCGNTIRLYVAFHKEKNSYDIAVNIKRSDGDPIPVDWWQPYIDPL